MSWLLSALEKFLASKILGLLLDRVNSYFKEKKEAETEEKVSADSANPDS